MKRAACLLAAMLLLTLTAAAQDTPKAEVFAGYSYVRATPATSGVPSFNLNGGSASVSVNPTSSLGLVGEFGGYHVGNVAGVPVNGTIVTYLFGPKLASRRWDSITPSAQVLFGGARASASVSGTGSSQNAFAMAAGGGLDAKLTEHIGVRLGQVDYLLTRFQESSTGGRQSQNNLRLSTGIIFRF